MQYLVEMSKLVIQHMEIVENLPSIARTVELDFFQTLNERLERKMLERGDWGGDYDVVVNEYSNETCIYPHSWMKKGYLRASYSIKLDVEQESEYYWLAHAIGVHDAPLCFCFEIQKNFYDISERDLKKALRSLLMYNDKLTNAGFQISRNKKYIALPIQFDAKVIAEHYPNLDGSLSSLDNALNTIFGVHSEFNNFLKSIEDKESYLLKTVE